MFSLFWSYYISTILTFLLMLTVDMLTFMIYVHIVQ